MIDWKGVKIIFNEVKNFWISGTSALLDSTNRNLTKTLFFYIKKKKPLIKIKYEQNLFNAALDYLLLFESKFQYSLEGTTYISFCMNLYNESVEQKMLM